MIQRIQSIYLLLITALMVAVLLMPLGVLSVNTGVLEYSAFSVKSAESVVQPAFPVWIVGVLAILSVILSLVTVFLYKRRSLQIRLCTMNGLFLALFYVAYAIFFVVIYRDVDVDYTPNLAVSFPLISLILDILAIKLISKDEALVQSLNRLR